MTGTTIALQPDGKLIAGGYDTSGNVVIERHIASDTAWDLTPDTITFTDQHDVATHSIITSSTPVLKSRSRSAAAATA